MLWLTEHETFHCLNAHFHTEHCASNFILPDIPALEIPRRCPRTVLPQMRQVIRGVKKLASPVTFQDEDTRMTLASESSAAQISHSTSVLFPSGSSHHDAVDAHFYSLRHSSRWRRVTENLHFRRIIAEDFIMIWLPAYAIGYVQ